MEQIANKGNGNYEYIDNHCCPIKIADCSLKYLKFS
jgi:hypothetical protein